MSCVREARGVASKLRVELGAHGPSRRVLKLAMRRLRIQIVGFRYIRFGLIITEDGVAAGDRQGGEGGNAVITERCADVGDGIEGADGERDMILVVGQLLPIDEGDRRVCGERGGDGRRQFVRITLNQTSGERQWFDCMDNRYRGCGVLVRLSWDETAGWCRGRKTASEERRGQ